LKHNFKIKNLKNSPKLISERNYKTFHYFAQRFGISDVCRSVAEANMGGGFCIKAVTRYAVLCDVCFFFSFRLKRNSISVINKLNFRLGCGAEGIKG